MIKEKTKMNTTNEIKVLVGDNTADYGVRIASTLKSMGIAAFTRCKNSDVIFNSIIRDNQVIENGASYCLSKPFETETLCTIIKSVYSRPVSVDCCDKEILVTNTIQRLGIPAHIKGYHYLRTAILSTLESESFFDSITKQVYPAVASHHDTTPARVERAIRHAIEIAWDRGASAEISSLFGYNSEFYNCRPTNSEFIALISDKLRLKLRNH